MLTGKKTYHSIKVQGVCENKLRFINIVSKWLGSTHDSYILDNSSLKIMFESGTIPEGWLLGESGYPLRPWLLTSVINPTTRPEEGYNTAHIKTRNTVERSFGVLKSRFRRLDTLLLSIEGLQSYCGCCRSTQHVYHQWGFHTS
jgi:hypothetical protein